MEYDMGSDAMGYEAYMFGKASFALGKGPTYHKGKNKTQRYPLGGVNAYGMEMLGSEGGPLLDLQATQEQDAISPTSGLLDCGATASAGPEASVQRLISSVLAQDANAKVTIDQARRPYFRYGSGSCGRALYHVTMSSSISGREKHFEVFALPNPPEYVEKWFRPHMLVPILVGMSHIGPRGAGMIVDFNDGYYVNANDLVDGQPPPQDDSHHLSSNAKGHFILDIVYYLTEGQACEKGQCSVVVKSDEGPSSSNSSVLPGTRHVLPLQFMYTHECMESGVPQEARDDQVNVSARRAALHQLASHHAHVATSSASSSSRMIGAPVPSPQIDNNSSVQIPRDGSKEDGQGRDSPRHVKGNGSRSSRPSLLKDAVALLWTPSGSSSWRQPLGPVGALQSLLSQVVLCSQGRRPLLRHQDRECGDYTACPDSASPGCLGQHAYGGSHACGHRDGVRQEPEGCRQCALSRASGVPDRHKDSGLPEGLAEPPEPESRGDGGWSCGSYSAKHKPSIDGKLVGNGQPSTGMMPKRVAKAVVAMASLVIGGYQQELQSCLTEPQEYHIWEIGGSACSPLATSCINEGLKTMRINHFNGFDLYKAKTYQNLYDLVKIQRPRMIWITLRSDRWTPWGHLDCQDWESRQNLEARRRHERTMLRRMESLVEWVLDHMPMTEIFWEWPTDSLGWKEPALIKLEKKAWASGKDWLSCRVDGCRYGLRDQESRQFIKKRWLIKTTCPRFHMHFRNKVCVQPHHHLPVPAMDQKGKIEYPLRFAEAVANLWKLILFPVPGRRLPEDSFNEVMATTGEDVEDHLPNENPTESQQKEWHQKLRKFHVAAGHPSSRQLARLIREAGKPRWQVVAAEEFRCPSAKLCILGEFHPNRYLPCLRDLCLKRGNKS